MPENKAGAPAFNPADANARTRMYMDELLVEMRMIDAVLPDLTLHLFNETFSTPIMMPAFSHLDQPGASGRTPMQEYAAAAAEMNLVCWVGMEPDDLYEAIAKEGAHTGRIIKPFMDHQIVFDQIAYAKKLGAFAVGMDIDHFFGKDGNYDIVDDIPLGPVSAEDLAAYAEAAGDTPFVAKGVLSVSDAKKCEEAGCAGIFVSHHRGRVPFGAPPVMILQEIRHSMPDTKMKIFVDCSIDSGYDAFKALALGADAVSTGRAIMPGLMKDGKEGVKRRISAMNNELSELMGYTGIHNLNEMDSSVIIHNGRHL